MATGTLITVYRGYDIRDAAQFASGISLGVNIYRAGEFIGYEKNVAMAKSRIDAEVAKAKKGEPAGSVSDDVHTAVASMDEDAWRELDAMQRGEHPDSIPSAARFKANTRKMGRFENNPDDLI